MALYQLTVSPKMLGMDVFGMTAEPGRAVWEYQDGQRTETQRVSEAGKPLYRHPALLRVAGERPFEASILLDQEDGLGEFVEVVLSPDSTVTIRGERGEYGGLTLSVQGSVAKAEKQASK